MKKFTKVIALILSLTLLLCFTIGVSAAEAEDTGVDTAAKGSLTVYKVDLTNAKKDGAWDSSYVSTGVYDQIVNDTLTSYALKDVEFTYLRVADVVQVTESAADGADSDHVESLYGISKTAGADFLNALGLGNGVNRYEKADGSDQLDDSKYYYQSDVLISALSTALKANATTVKNALEAYVTESGTAMPLTDTYGKTKAENLELGLYLVVETKVPEMVTSTCNPFFICLPMTSSSGSWIYDVTVYPKNQTGNPTLDKTLRESKDDTGKEAAMSESKGKILFVILAVLLLLFGGGMILYPSLNGLWVERTMYRDSEDFLLLLEGDAKRTAEENFYVIPGEPEGEKSDVPEQYPQLWLDMKAYNEAIFREGQKGLSDPSAYEGSCFRLSDYGLDSEVFGVLSIPKLNLQMPIYMGATKENMAAGAAVMGQTSLPIGGSDTNCVLAGHRGWNGAAYFLYINQLEPGDTVTVTNLWETLNYKVSEVRVISPNDVEAILIQPGHELLTLLTCHPPASGGKQRYLVFCERTYL